MAERKRLSGQPLVSIISLNYNQAAVTAALLDSMRRLTYPRYEVIIVDNGSADDPTPLLRAGQYANLTIVRTGTNLGFSGGNNVGLAHANGDYILFLNNDTEVTPNLIEQLLDPFRLHRTVGVVCPKIRYHHTPDQIQYAGYGMLNPFTGQVRAIGTGEVDRGQYDRPGVTNFAHGAAMLVSRSVVNRVGPMPTIFFLYYEELDWSRQIQQAGYSIYYQPSALVYHKESVSVGRQSALKVYYHTRNRLLFMRRNERGLAGLIFWFFFAGFALPKALLTYGLARRWDCLWAFMRGVGWNCLPNRGALSG